ncbi:MAG: transposase [Bdellovibrionales bacterium]|nr:transposase [Bdellovibrionales bacterium]
MIRSCRLPYHLTARSNNREKFPGSDLSYVWKVLTGELYLQAVCHGVRAHSLVLMPNHFHLILTSPRRDIDLVMRDVLSSSTRIINTKHRRWGRVFGSRYFWTLIDNPVYYAHAIKYVSRNPVKAALCDEVAEYPFSTFGCAMGVAHLPLSIYPPSDALDALLPAGLSSMEQWLNIPYRSEESDAIRRALRHKRFKLPLRRSTRKPLRIATEI